MEEYKKRLYFERVDLNIEQNGFHITYVLEQDNFTPFGYSTGLYKNFGIPEVFISGLPNGLTTTLINNYAKIYKNQKVPLHIKLNNLIDRFSVYIIPVVTNDLDNKILSSFKFYENYNFECVQIIFPDLKGKFPNEVDYNYDQEIFGKIL